MKEKFKKLSKAGTRFLYVFTPTRLSEINTALPCTKDHFQDLTHIYLKCAYNVVTPLALKNGVQVDPDRYFIAERVGLSDDDFPPRERTLLNVCRIKVTRRHEDGSVVIKIKKFYNELDLDGWLEVHKAHSRAEITYYQKLYALYTAALERHGLADIKYTLENTLGSQLFITSESCHYMTGSDVVKYDPILVKKFHDKDSDAWIQKSISSYKLRMHRYSNADILFFAATIFSLLKPLYRICKLPSTDFCLQIDLGYPSSLSNEHGDSPIDIAHEFTHEQINAFCNHSESNEFRRSYHAIGTFSPVLHRCFPVVLSNDEVIMGDLTEDIDERMPPQIPAKIFQNLKTSRCLPILLPQSLPTKQYPPNDCLTVKVAVTQQAVKKFRHINRRDYHIFPIHTDTLSYYKYFLECIECHTLEDLTKLKQELVTAYRDGLQKQGATVKTATRNQELRAFLLSALALALNRAPIPDHAIYYLDHPSKTLEEILLNVASSKTFAQFIQQAAYDTSKYHHIILDQDASGVYLDYKKYWVAFQSYCVEHNVTLTASAGGFRKSELAVHHFIRPQYAPKGGGYPRYDYRRVIGSKKVDVLNVKPGLFKEYDISFETLFGNTPTETPVEPSIISQSEIPSIPPNSPDDKTYSDQSPADSSPHEG